MKFYDARNVGSLRKTFPQVNVHGIPQSIDLSRSTTALFLGGTFPWDSACSFPAVELRIQNKMVSDTSKQLALTGASHDTFETEQSKVLNSSLQIQGKRSIFLFATNAKVTKKDRENVVGARSMLVSEKEWDRFFTPLFSALKAKAYTAIKQATKLVK